LSPEADDESVGLKDIYYSVKEYGQRFDRISSSVSEIGNTLNSLSQRFERLITLVEILVTVQISLLVAIVVNLILGG